jgi:hypothetical protein
LSRVHSGLSTADIGRRGQQYGWRLGALATAARVPQVPPGDFKILPRLAS